MTKTRVEMRDVHKSYGTNDVIKGVDLKVEDNEVVVLIGPSGAGKSTVLRMINGLETTTSGDIMIDGEDIAKPGVASIRFAKRSGWCSNTLTSSRT